MLLEESNKMSKKTPSQDSNFEDIWWEMEDIEPLTPPVKAKKIDDWWFHEEPLNMVDENLSCGRKSRVP